MKLVQWCAYGCLCVFLMYYEGNAIDATGVRWIMEIWYFGSLMTIYFFIFMEKSFRVSIDMGNLTRNLIVIEHHWRRFFFGIMIKIHELSWFIVVYHLVIASNPSHSGLPNTINLVIEQFHASLVFHPKEPICIHFFYSFNWIERLTESIKCDKSPCTRFSSSTYTDLSSRYVPQSNQLLLENTNNSSQINDDYQFKQWNSSDESISSIFAFHSYFPRRKFPQ